MSSKCHGRLGVRVLACAWFVVVGGAGCSIPVDTGPSVVINAAWSPDSQTAAILMRHIWRAALNNDVYYVILAPGRQPWDVEAMFRSAQDSSVLDATRAESLKFRWQNDRELHVICAQCGLETIDVTRKLDHHGPVRIVYEGFPMGTAY